MHQGLGAARPARNGVSAVRVNFVVKPRTHPPFSAFLTFTGPVQKWGVASSEYGKDRLALQQLIAHRAPQKTGASRKGNLKELR